MNSVRNPKKLPNFPTQSKNGRYWSPIIFPWHHIMFSYQLPYLLNNTKWSKNMKKQNRNSQKFYWPFLSLDAFIRGGCRAWVAQVANGPKADIPYTRWRWLARTIRENQWDSPLGKALGLVWKTQSRSVFGLFPGLWPMGLASSDWLFGPFGSLDFHVDWYPCLLNCPSSSYSKLIL
jgi:hypothetical protein